MKNILIVIDMQNDFITGSLGTKEAQAILPNVVAKVQKYKEHDWPIFFTQDTHYDDDYLKSLEGKYLPVKHCIFYTEGWALADDLRPKEYYNVTVEKDSFAFTNWPMLLNELINDDIEIEICGLCTDICVISNALFLRSQCPNTKIICDSSCCAGTTPEMHENALKVMKSCQIQVI